VTAPASLGAIGAQVDRRLMELLGAERARWEAVDPDLGVPFGEIDRLVVAGGKRLRPAFCYWGFVGTGGDPDDQRVIDAGAALELLHAFALFHDDVMDDSATRRGEPTTHVVAAEQHAREGWVSDSRRFGDGVAILVGDLAHVYADRLLTGATAAVWELWHELRTELNIGQYLDILGSVRSERRLDRARRICRYKSGKYTVERPLHLGALLARDDAALDTLSALSRYGLPLGDAFQLRDDVMGAFGDTAATGKPVGDDLREGKPTPLLAMATEMCEVSQRAVLRRVGAPDLSADEIQAIQRVIVDSGALERHERLIAELVAEALAALEGLPLTATARDELAALAEYVTARRT
jgi:geranylgeranyl diphosphate synthase type I